MGVEPTQELQKNSTETRGPSIALRGTLVLQVNPDGRDNIQIELAAPAGYVIGRSDAKSSFNPDIDMATFNALDKGVSRRHAALVSHNNTLAALDLSSVNGTFLNGTRLLPETPTPVHQGDTLSLGDLLIQISVL
ncbi:MAG: FHA domain-containing protein [Anaerolineae bacterium]|nr:FHA domain-containing protein [Anaerolineae bacterium]